MSLEPITGLPLPPPWLPAFESEWPFTIPTRFTDNVWRGQQSITRAIYGLTTGLPPYPTTAQIKWFVRPALDQTVAEAGDGLTPATAFTRVSSARAAAAAGEVVGVCSGTEIRDVVDLLATNNFLPLQAPEAGQIWCTWFENPAERHPCRLRRMTNLGTSAGNWEEVDLKPGSAAGTLVATSGVYTLLPGSGNWHLKTPAVLVGTLFNFGLGTYDSIIAQVDSTGYKGHGWDSPHVSRHAVEDSGATQCVRASALGFAPLDQDAQFCATNNGGLVVRSVANPATRGGVWVCYIFDAGVAIANTNGVQWLHAMQFDGVGMGVRFNAGASTCHDNYVEGVYTRLCAQPWGVASGNNGQPAGIGGGPNTGSLNRGAPGNETAFSGDGTTPWIQDNEVYYVRALHSFASPSHTGWYRRNRYHDIRSHRTRLTGGGGFYIGGSFAFDYADYNEWFHLYLSELDCAVGEFAFSDGGIDFDAWCHNARVHHFRVQTSIRTCSPGGGRGIYVYDGEFLDVVQGPVSSDTQGDGTSEPTFAHIRQVHGLASDWASCVLAPGLAFAHEDIDNNVAINIERKLSMAPAGPVGDNEVRFHNNHWRMFNYEVDMGTADPAKFYLYQNETVDMTQPGNVAALLTGPWHDDGAGVAHNGAGYPVPPGQVQKTALYKPPIVGLRLVGEPITTQLYVDRNLVDAATELASTVSGFRIDAFSNRNNDGTLLPTAPAAVRGGNIFLGAVMEGPDEPWLQPGAGHLDLSGRAASVSAQKALGPLDFTGEVIVVSGRPDEYAQNTLSAGSPLGSAVRALYPTIMTASAAGTWTGVIGLESTVIGGTFGPELDNSGVAITFTANGSREVPVNAGMEYRLNFSTATSGTPLGTLIVGP